MPSHRTTTHELCKLFAMIETPGEAEILLTDLLTPQELDAISERWELIRALASGLPQREIAKKLGIAISTVTRGSIALKYGSGGFRYFLKKVKGARKKTTEQRRVVLRARNRLSGCSPAAL